MKYKRDNKGVEIIGEPNEIKDFVRTDLRQSHQERNLKLIIVIILAISSLLISKINFIPFVLPWFIKQINFLIFPIFVCLHLLLSG